MRQRCVAFLDHPSISCWRFTAAHAEELARALGECLPGATVERCTSREELLEALPRAHAALVWRFEQAWFDKAPQLRCVATPAAGRDYFHVVPPADVSLLYGGFHGELMAETVIAMMLAFRRGILLAERRRAVDPWPREALASTMRPLRGDHLLIAGFGQVGRWIGRLAKPFGVRITGIRRHAAASPPEYFTTGDRELGLEQLEAVLPSADHLVLALPGGAATDHFLDASRLRLLPPHALLYNVGRGDAIDEGALIAALTEGRIAGAGLDVFEREPLATDSPLRVMDNVLLLPHAAAISPNYLDLFVREIAPRLAAVLG